MRKQIFRSTYVLVVLAVVLTSILVAMVAHLQTYRHVQEKLQFEAALLKQGIAADGEMFLQSIPNHTTHHIIWLTQQGDVLYDTDGQTTVDLLVQPEVQAVRNGQLMGQNMQLSADFSQQIFAYACYVSDGTILRITDTAPSALGMLNAGAVWIVLVLLISLALTYFRASRVADAMARQLNALDCAQIIQELPYDEISPLVGQLNEHRRTAQRQLAELSARQEEFRTLAENMGEGLLLLGTHAEIFSINAAACRILEADPTRQWHGQHLLHLSRNHTLQTLVKEALQGVRSEDVLQAGHRQYEMIASPIVVQEQTRGALVVLLDVTERLQAEQVRREFSANVSHELKTPLTSISGYAELLANARVQPQDIIAFATRIHQEAARLLVLIEDIIKLSYLDEHTAPPAAESIDMYALAQQVAERLMLQAQAREIVLEVQGVQAVVCGARTQLTELLYNLIENAIKYNRTGGRVQVCVTQQSSEVTVCIADTGIGIPESAQSRVFERFYRVDKSRASETGGTGLGLSIVKHIAALHHAHITMHSIEQQGTTITVRFPIQ